MTARVHPRAARRFLVGTGAAAVATGMIWYSVGAGSSGGLPGSARTYVQAVFRDVGPLVVNDDVREDSVRIGQVSAIKLENGKAVVTLELNGRVPVYANARASVWDQSVLAEKFVELNPGTRSSGPLHGNLVSENRTSSSVSLDQLFDVFNPPTRAGLQTTVQQLGTGLAGHGGDLNSLLRASPRLVPDAGQVAGTLASPRSDLPGVLNSADTLSSRFTSEQAQLSSLVNQTSRTLDALDTDGGQPLSASLRQLPATLAGAQTTFDRLNRPLSDAASAMTTLRPGGTALGESSDNLRGFLRESVTPLDKTPAVADDAQPAVTALTQTFSDARPVIPDLSQGLGSALPLLETVAPYAGDIQRFFGSYRLLSSHVGNQHGLRIAIVLPYPQSAASEVTPGLVRDPYPAPGQAYSDRSASPASLSLGGGR